MNKNMFLHKFGHDIELWEVQKRKAIIKVAKTKTFTYRRRENYFTSLWQSLPCQH